ncbi:MAG: hypothetical protein MUF34_13665 [Polyangiaceae bacterium]|nr:hypothetical protein [Polyangiaceae bacterium]
MPPAALEPFLTATSARWQLDAGDALQIIPVRMLRARRASWLQSPLVAAGELVFALSVTREARGRDLNLIDTENRELLALALDLGAKSYLIGTLPRGEAEWRAHLGEGFEALAQTKRLADPAGILGANLSLLPPTQPEGGV